MKRVLAYRPVIKTVPVSSDFRKKVLNRLWPKGNYGVPVEVDQTWVGYFRGLQDAGYMDAELIIDALEAHGKIQFDFEE